MMNDSTYYFLIRQISTDLILSRSIGRLAETEDDESATGESLFAPPERSVQALLGYARSLEVNKSESVGQVEWVLN